MWWSALPRRAVALPVILGTLVALPGCIQISGADLGRYAEREEKHFTTAGKPAISLKTFDGSIEVRAWDKPDVQVTIEKHAMSKAAADTIEVRAEQNGNAITIEARVPPSRGFGIHFGSARSAKLIVSAPASADVTAGSGDGSIELEGVNGRLQLRSGDGSIRARAVGGDVDVRTGDGSVTLSGALTSVRAHSGDGSVTVHADTGSTVQHDWEITTGDGSVTLEIPDGFGAELDAHTGDGRISTRDVAVSNVTGRIGRTSLRGRLGQGGGSVRIRTGDGSIRINRS